MTSILEIGIEHGYSGGMPFPEISVSPDVVRHIVDMSLESLSGFEELVNWFVSMEIETGHGDFSTKQVNELDELLISNGVIGVRPHTTGEFRRGYLSGLKKLLVEKNYIDPDAFNRYEINSLLEPDNMASFIMGYLGISSEDIECFSMPGLSYRLGFVTSTMTQFGVQISSTAVPMSSDQYNIFFAGFNGENNPETEGTAKIHSHYQAGLQLWLSEQGIRSIDTAWLDSHNKLQALKDGLTGVDRSELVREYVSEQSPNQPPSLYITGSMINATPN